ncbi:hypothetical protein [Streptomyces sp. NPDC006267]|uniref:hypothetical protein n=1 Tax=Streptomyces sp. NPDC006267 TaxID=3157173 RepID=UPI0033BB6156
MAGRAREGSETYGRLMLFAALLFGIVTMHTVGHPAEHGRSPSSPPAMAGHLAQDPAPARAPAHGQSRTTAHGPAQGLAHGFAQVPAPGPAPAPAGGAADAQHPSPHDSPGPGVPAGGMDPLSVCLAVLGVWGLALLAAWLLGLRPDGRPLGTPVGAGPLRVLRPIPPPRISVLASVSVLRI